MGGKEGETEAGERDEGKIMVGKEKGEKRRERNTREKRAG